MKTIRAKMNEYIARGIKSDEALEKAFKVSGPKVPQGYVVRFEIKEVKI